MNIETNQPFLSTSKILNFTLMKGFWLYCMVILMLSCSGKEYNEVLVQSPNNTSQVRLELMEGRPYWSVKYKDKPILRPSRLGLVIEGSNFEGPFIVMGTDKQTIDTTWIPVWGKSNKIRNHYNEVVWYLQEQEGTKRNLEIVVRTYDDGVAVRYRINGDKTVEITDDLTEFSFTEDHTCWGANLWQPNLSEINLPDFIGPVKLNNYKGFGFPITVEVDKNCYASMLEAGIYDIAKLIPKAKGQNTIKCTHKASKLQLSGQTSWRVLLLGDKPGDLLTSNVMVNLNPPTELKVTSWIKPGLALWDWRVWGSKASDGFTYGLDMPSWKRQIDFASEHGITYLLLDAGWYGLEFDPKSDPTTSRDYLLYQPDPNRPELKPIDPPKDWKDPIDIPGLIKYAKERHVGIILYLNDVIKQNFDIENTLKTYNEWGASGIKYGFMSGDGQVMLNKTREIVELCGKYKLTCDFHDEIIPPSGDRRKNPYYLSREFCHSQADGLQSFTPETFCTTVFTNMLAGPLDMDNGFLTLTDIEKVRPKVFKPIHSTVVSEAARVLIVFSGLAVLPDSPDSYAGKPDLFEFISKLPMTWDETKILNGKIGEYITTARRSGDEWFIGSACDSNGVELPIEFDFLTEGKTYWATLYEDSPESHYIHNKDQYQVRKITVKKGDKTQANLAPGGGHCIWLKPMDN